MPQAAGEPAMVEEILFQAFLVVRGAQLAVGALTSAVFWRSYRHHVRLLATLAGLLGEYGWLVGRWRRTRRLSPRESGVDAAVSLAALVVGSPSVPSDLGDLNWVHPLTVSAVMPAAMASSERLPGAVVATTLAAAYVAVLPARREGAIRRVVLGGSHAVYYFAFAAATNVIGTAMRRWGEEAKAARAEAVRQGERLSAARERERQRRILHDRALQTLEIVAGEWPVDAADVRKMARREAAELRRALAEDAGGAVHAAAGGLEERLAGLASELGGLGLEVEVVVTDLDGEPRPAVADALVDAAREALTNVVRHAGTDRAVLCLATGTGEALVTIRDRGRGFDPDARAEGFGMTHSIRGRLADVGGSLTVRSSPGSGTMVLLAVPLP